MTEIANPVEKYPDPIVDRMCEIWVRLLRNIKYDNGDPGGLAMAMASTMTPKIPEEALERFRVELKRAFREGVPGPYGHHASPSLSVYYDPCPILHVAADRAGLSLSGKQWPWKTNVYVSKEFVSVSAGYSAPDVYHYPMPDGRWLVCKLRGDDMRKVIALALAGHGEWVIEGP